MLRLRLQREALFGRLPLEACERSLTAVESIAAGVNAATLSWSLLVGGYTARILNVTQGTVALSTGWITGHTLATLVLLGCHRWGCDGTDLSKPCLGQRGAKLVMLVHFVCQLSWAGLVLAMGGQCTQVLLHTLGVPAGDGTRPAVMAAALLAVYGLMLQRGRLIALCIAVATPGVLMLVGLLALVVLRDTTFAELARIAPVMDVAERQSQREAAFTYGLGAGLCGWPTLATLMRHARRVRAVVYPQLASMGVLASCVATVGLGAALLFRAFDPAMWLCQMRGTAFGTLALACVTCALLAGCATNLVVVARSLRHLRRLRQLSWPTLTTLPLVPLLPLVGLSEWAYVHGSAVLIITAYLMAPIAGVLAFDYLALRRQRINLSQIYDDSRHATYWYWGGFNWVALASMGLGIAVGLIGLYREGSALHPRLTTFGGAPIGTAVAVGLYWFCVRLVLIPRGVGGFLAPAAPQAILHHNL